jgi:hypothetical protein
MSRLERVEKENRRMKQAALGVVVIVCSVFLMGQVRPNRTIEAQRFVVKDSNGKVRAAFGMEDNDPKGATLAIGSAGLTVAGEEERYTVYLHGGDIAWLILSSKESTDYINARVGPPDNSLPSPQLSVGDRDGYSTDIGHTDLVTTRTGEKHHTSAASVVMIGKDKKTLWSAP